MSNYPRWFLPTLLGALLLIMTTGLLLAPTTLALRADWDIAWRLTAPHRVAAAAAHAATGFFMMLLIGALWSLHMRSGWRRRKQRPSGLLLGVLLLGLALTAIGVYYLGDEALADWAAFMHLGLGLLFLGPMVWHWLRGRQARRAHRLHHGTRRHAIRLTERPAHKVQANVETE
jgi:hypothetical protein